MKEQKKNDKQSLKSSKGITLIALVISIIVMLILAGVSLNAVVGENGVLTQAQNAVIENKKAQILEALNLELTSYNVDTITGDPEEIKTMIRNLLNKDLIETVLLSSSEYSNTVGDDDVIMGIPNFDASNNYTGFIDYAVTKEGYQIIISIDDSGIYKAEFGIVNVGAGGNVAAGTTVVTSNAFENGSTDPAESGKFTITENASIMFVEVIDKPVSIHVESGVEATVNIFKNMTLTNKDIPRSAIDIEPGGKLNLHLEKDAEVIVNSGLGQEGDELDYLASNTGGFAGIRVVWKDMDGDNIRDEGEYGVLNLTGTGKITAIGGDAGDGNIYTGGGGTSSRGGSGGGGAGAGIGGNGGEGSGYAVGKGASGGAGENCGEVNIESGITLLAYGGAGGSGANGYVENGGGGGGYPAAGIGGGGAGGAGGTCCTGGGGYSGGGGDRHDKWTESATLIRGGYGGINGNAGEKGASIGPLFSGSGYNLVNTRDIWQPLYDKGITLLAGGMGGINNRTNGHVAGDGGIGGQGGIITSASTNVKAFNGNKYTDETWTIDKDGKKIVTYIHGHENPSEKPENQTEIYGQNGVINARYLMEKCTYNGSTVEFSVEQEYDEHGIQTTNYINPISGNHQGVGSGAGYIEISNGTYN